MGKKKPRRKHVPLRTCIACRQKREKRSLTRIVRTPDAGVVVDSTGKRNGRGAYVCVQEACWDKILNTRLLDKALMVTVTEAEKTALATNRPVKRGER